MLVANKISEKTERKKRSAGLRKVQDSSENIDIPTWSKGQCVKCGHKGDLADKLCVNCWDKTNDANYTLQHSKQYRKNLE